MNRRSFLQSLAAIGGSVALPVVSLASAPDSVIADVWQQALAAPMTFYVKPAGTISFGASEEYPTARCSLFMLEPVSNRDGLFGLADATWGFGSVLENEWIERDSDDSGYENWESWLRGALDEVVDELIAIANDWLEDAPDETDWENADLCGYTEQGAALTFFRDDFEFNDLFNIVIVEGAHPGSTYYAAELRMDVDDANQLALDEGIPVRFEWSGD